MKNLSQYLTRKEFDDGRVIVTRTDDAPQWTQDLIYEAHGDMLPDDWKYKMIEFVADEVEDADDMEDIDAGEIANRFVDNHCYTHERLQWLASNLQRPGYCDEAQEEGLVHSDATMDQRVAIGMYTECCEVASIILAGLLEDEEVA